jgi:hypothetical protein
MNEQLMPVEHFIHWFWRFFFAMITTTGVFIHINGCSCRTHTRNTRLALQPRNMKIRMPRRRDTDDGFWRKGPNCASPMYTPGPSVSSASKNRNKHFQLTLMNVGRWYIPMWMWNQLAYGGRKDPQIVEEGRWISHFLNPSFDLHRDQWVPELHLLMGTKLSAFHSIHRLILQLMDVSKVFHQNLHTHRNNWKV